MRQFIIDKYNSGKKTFRFIQSILPGLTNTEIFKLLRKDVIKVNDKNTDSNYELKENDKVYIYLADFHFEKKGKGINNKFHSVDSNIDVVFEDQDVLVVNKPAGLLIHPDKKEFKTALSEMVKAYLYRKGEYNPESYFSPSPCHRLDSNTSGLVVFAKNQKSLRNITEQFRERSTSKIYLGIFYGKIANKVLFTSYIDAEENKENKVTVSDFKTFMVIPAREEFLEKNRTLSATLINPIKWTGNCTYSEIELWTGKKHQIRAHLQSSGNPLLGDNKYSTNPAMSLSQMFNIKKYFLHGYKLKLLHYDEWKAPLSADFTKILSEIFKTPL
jgi:23S rRNA pseudouridine955/2504/2580 synthase